MPDPVEPELRKLHERLLSDDVVAPRDLAERVVPLVRNRLAQLERSVGDPHLVPSVIGLVVAKYLREPQRFEPARGGLIAYLAMEARSDVLNELEARRRRRTRELPVADPVELEPRSGDSTVEEEALDAVDPFGVAPMVAQGALRALQDLDHLDRQLLQLMADGVRATSAYAAVLGLSHLPVELQRKAVKRHKDRLQKRLERLRGQLS
ncbi:MAG TPA: hypothetical protein VG276_12430 [Actinomycetes bacterium]|nr:hypothetical protein [Actinomycetes bacterium]